jgi:hypothetical protein
MRSFGSPSFFEFLAPISPPWYCVALVVAGRSMRLLLSSIRVNRLSPSSRPLGGDEFLGCDRCHNAVTQCDSRHRQCKSAAHSLLPIQGNLSWRYQGQHMPVKDYK